jgi:hypothetical protein
MSRSFDGGVNPQGQDFYETETVIPQQTAITKEILQEAANTSDKVWRGKSGRQYAALAPDVDSEFIRQAERLRSFKPVTKDMVLAQMQNFRPASNPGRGMLDDPVAAKDPGNGAGMLDDIDPKVGGVHVIPGGR